MRRLVAVMAHTVLTGERQSMTRVVRLCASIVLLALLVGSTLGLSVGAQNDASGSYGVWEVTVTGTEQRAEVDVLLQDEPSKARGIYQLVFMTVTNTANTADHFPFDDLILTDNGGRSFTNFNDATLAVRVEVNDPVGDFQPGLEYQTAIVFDVPTDTVPVSLGSADGQLSISIANTEGAPRSAENTAESTAGTDLPTRDIATGESGDQVATIVALERRVATLEANATAQASVIAGHGREIERFEDRVATVAAHLGSQEATKTPATKTPTPNSTQPAETPSSSGSTRRDYLDAVTEQRKLVLMAYDIIQPILNAGGPQDSSTATRLISAFAFWHVTYASAQELSPPDGLHDLHDQHLESLRLFALAGDTYVTAMDANDESAKAEAIGYIGQAVEIYKAVEEDLDAEG